MMIVELIAMLIPMNFISAYILLDEQQFRSHILTKRKFLCFLTLHAIILGIASLFNYPIWKTFVMVIINLITGYRIFHHHRIELIRDGCFALCIGICELIILPIIQFINVNWTVNITNAIWFFACSMLIVQLIVFYMYHLYRKFHVMEKDENTGFALLNFVFLPIFSFVNVIIISTISQFYIYTWLLIASILDIIFIVFVNIYLSYIYHSIMQSQRLKQELALYEQKNEMQYAYYQKLEENYQKSRQLIHDVKRHLQMIQASSEDQVYKEDFQNYLNQYAMPIYSNHQLLNMILYEKAQEAKQENITFTCESCIIQLDFIKEIDITTIFLNLLDNAMDACKECVDDKWICWKADIIRDFLVIEIQNSIHHPPKQGLSSSKHYHEGLGLKNVAQALERYGGNMQITFDDVTFTVHLYIPMK